jgi:hypothetical protein
MGNLQPGSALLSDAANMKIRHDDQMATYKALRAYLLHYYSESFLDEVEIGYPHADAYLRLFTTLKQDLRIKA